MHLHIRKAEFRDCEEIMNLLHQVNDIHADGRPDLFIHGATKYTIDQLADIISNPATPVFVAVKEDENVVGYCFCIVEDHSASNNLRKIKTLYIDDLCVGKKYRGFHIGHSLYNHVKGYAQDNGFYNLTLNVWSCNPTAIRFYESLGMKSQKIGMEELL